MSKLTDDEIDELDKQLKPKYIIEITKNCIEASNSFNEKDLQAMILANEEISKRVYYGIREETTQADGIVLSWSNGSKDWYGGNDKINRGKKLHLDANEIFLPISPERFERIKACLGVLPLYFGSFEAQAKGEICRADTLTIWGKGQIERMIRERKK